MIAPLATLIGPSEAAGVWTIQSSVFPDNTVLAVVTVMLLAKAFGSLLLPVKAVLLNLASVGAT